MNHACISIVTPSSPADKSLSITKFRIAIHSSVQSRERVYSSLTSNDE